MERIEGRKNPHLIKAFSEGVCTRVCMNASVSGEGAQSVCTRVCMKASVSGEGAQRVEVATVGRVAE